MRSAASHRTFAIFAPALLAALALVPLRLAAQTDAELALGEWAESAALDETFPIDPAVTVGTLDNGLRYYIRENDEPQSRAQLRLIVAAGSVLEAEDQLGLAHVLEHMAFNGSENFAKQEIVDYMRSIGMQLGPGINAATSFDSTTYMLTVPTADPSMLETAFRIMEDWAHGLTLDAEEIEQERRVVTEEWRDQQGAGARVSERHERALFYGSRYALRPPIGTPESLSTFGREPLERFYRDWYRPDLMAVVAVGDFDAARVEALVRAHFGALTTPEDAPERVVYDVPAHEEALFSIATDPEVPTASVSVYHKTALDRIDTVGAYRRRLAENFYVSLLQQRYNEIARRPGSPFRSASVGHGRLVRSASASVLAAQVPEDGIARGLEALVTEVERVARFGFTETELARAKTRLQTQIEQRYENRANERSSGYAAEYVSAFVNGEPIPGLTVERALIRRFAPEITLEEVNAVGRRWLRDSSRVVLVTAPQKADLAVPDETALRAAFASAASAELEPYVDTGADSVLLAEVPSGSEIVAARDKAGGITEWELGNGVRVVLKPTRFEENQVSFRAVSPGGYSLVADADAVPARMAATAVQIGGLGGLDITGLQKALTGKIVRADAAFGLHEELLFGGSATRDLETLFELIYLRFTAPRADPEAFATFTEQQRQQLMNREQSPAVRFNDANLRLVSQDHPRLRPLTAQRLAEADLDRSLEFYEDRFADASDFTFVFVGSFDAETMRPLVERYLGALPSTGREEEGRDVGIRFPRGIVTETIRAGSEPRAQTRISFAPRSDVVWRDEAIVMTALGLVLQSRLSDVIRETLGGTYGVSAGTVAYLEAERTFAPAIMFGADPQSIDELVGVVFDEIEMLKREGPEERRVVEARETLLRQYETRIEDNEAWLSALAESYQYDPEPGAEVILRDRDEIAALTASAIQAAARRYLDEENYVRVTLLPEQ